MELCWSAEPSQRPLLGYVQPQLQNIQARALANSPPGKFTYSCSPYSTYAIDDDCCYSNYDFLQFREY